MSSLRVSRFLYPALKPGIPGLNSRRIEEETQPQYRWVVRGRLITNSGVQEEGLHTLPPTAAHTEYYSTQEETLVYELSPSEGVEVVAVYVLTKAAEFKAEYPCLLVPYCARIASTDSLPTVSMRYLRAGDTCNFIFDEGGKILVANYREN